MRRFILSTCLAFSAVIHPARLCGAVPELRALFPQQAEITAPGGQLARLVLPSEVIAACRGDLSDLRIFDQEGREVPYFVDSGLALEEAVREVRRTVIPELLSVSREEVAREGAPNLRRERYKLSAPGDPPAAGAWDLVVESRHPAFVRRVVITVSDGIPASDGIPIADTPPIADGSFFRLRQPMREKLRLTLPAAAARGVVVTLEGAESFYLAPTFRFETTRTLLETERAEVALEEVSRTAGESRTRVELARPRGLAPDLLRLATSTDAFHRQVEVWDEGPGAANEVLGRGVVFRVPPVDGIRIDEMELAVGRARGDRLRLVVLDGDSPPLDELVVRAVLRRPALVFSLAAASAGGNITATLAFGGGRAFPPRYDLAALVPRVGTLRGSDAEVGERLYDPTLLGTAELGEVVANPRFDSTPMLAFAHRAGSALDERRFRRRRELVATPSPEGLVRLTLDLEDLAEAREDLADVRIVDGEGRQWAYLLERQVGEEVRALGAPEPEVEDGISRYRVELPATPATLVRLVLETDAAFFDRDYELIGRRGQKNITLARGRLARRIGDPRPVVITCAAEPVEQLELRVRDGDDAALAFTSVQGHFPVPALYFAALAGHYALLLGDPDASAPRYELERVRGLILTVASGETAAGALVDNPAYSARARFASDKGQQQLLLWVALAAAVVILTVLTLRLARRDELHQE